MDDNPEHHLPESPDRWPLRLLIPALIWAVPYAIHLFVALVVLSLLSKG